MKKSIPFIFAALLIFLFVTCENELSNTKNGNDKGTGRLFISITDDPFDINLIESAEVTITKVEIRKTDNSDTTGNHSIVLMEDTVKLDLMDLRNGITANLVDLEIPAGEYDLVSLYVDEASLKLKDYAEPFKVKVPSGKQTGIKVFISPALQVEGGLTSELLLDFDLSKSFVLRGNLNHASRMNGFIFKPVIRACNISTSGRIEGKVTDTTKAGLENVKVWLMKDTVYATTFTDTLGYYAFPGIPASTYSIFAHKEGFDTLFYEGIKVIQGNSAVQNFILVPE